MNKQANEVLYCWVRHAVPEQSVTFRLRDEFCNEVSSMHKGDLHLLLPLRKNKMETLAPVPAVSVC